MKGLITGFFLALILAGFLVVNTSRLVYAQAVTRMPTISVTDLNEATASSEAATPTITETPEPPRPDITQKSEETLGPLEALLKTQELGSVWPFNPLKYAIRGSISAGVPANTLVLLLILPVAAAVIAAIRHLVGVRGLGIFLPTSLSVVFLATGPIVGVGLFLVIVTVSTAVRMLFRHIKFRMQYLPRMATILWAVVLGVLGVLFMAPILPFSQITNVSIFPVLILALLAEDFTKVQLGKSARTAVILTSETLILALVSYIFLTLKPLQEYALLNPEIVLLAVFVFNYILGKYTGLRLLELWRFRRLISTK